MKTPDQMAHEIVVALRGCGKSEYLAQHFLAGYLEALIRQHDDFQAGYLKGTQDTILNQIEFSSNLHPLKPNPN